MLFTKSIFLPKSISDGLRISIMSRHTLEDGQTPHPRITESSYDLWLKILAPPAKLVGDYYKRGLSFEDYGFRYTDYLLQPLVFEEVKKLANLAERQDITLLCFEESAEKCHRRIIAEECKKCNPLLRIEHR